MRVLPQSNLFHPAVRLLTLAATAVQPPTTAVESSAPAIPTPADDSVPLKFVEAGSRLSAGFARVLRGPHLHGTG